MKKYKTLRAYAGDLCKREGGLSEAKIGDVVQILNMVALDYVRSAQLTSDLYIQATVLLDSISNPKTPSYVNHLLYNTGVKLQRKREKELKRKKKV